MRRAGHHRDRLVARFTFAGLTVELLSFTVLSFTVLTFTVLTVAALTVASVLAPSQAPAQIAFQPLPVDPQTDATRAPSDPTNQPEASLHAMPAGDGMPLEPKQRRVTDSGLEIPPGRLWGVAEDDLGYLWLASESGLLFDGGANKAMTVEATVVGQAGLDRPTTSVAQSSDHGVWYADGALKHLNPWANKVTVTDIPADTIVDGPDQTKWVIAGFDRVRLIDGPSLSVLHETPIEFPHRSRGPNPAAAASDGTLYISGGSTIVEITIDGTVRSFTATSDVAAITSSVDGGVLFSTLSGLWRLDPNATRPELLTNLPTPVAGVLPTTALAQLADGTILVGLGGGGLGVFDPETSSWINDSNEPSTEAVIELIFEQRSGTVWLATDRGELLNYHDAAEFGAIALPDDQVPRSLAYVRGAIWVALGPDGVASFDPTTRAWIRPISFDDVIDMLDEIPHANAIAEFGDGVWIATANEGILTVEGNDRQAKLAQGLTNQTDQLIDDEQRLYSISTEQSQVMSLDREGRVAWELNWDARENHGRSAVAAVSNDLLYLVSNVGVGIFDTTDTSDAPIQFFEDIEWAPWANDIVVRDQVAWIATEIGLVRLDLTSGDVQRISSTEGLPSNMVTALIATSDDNKLWVGTNAGLSLLDLDTQTVVANFGSADGLPTDAILPIQGVSDAEGNGYVVTKDGIAVLPAAAGNWAGQPLSFAVRCRSGCGELETPNLIRNPDRLNVDLVSSDGTRARLMPIEYRLDGEGAEWEHLPPGIRTVTFGSLAPGTHRLEVRAANADAGEGSAIITRLSIEVDEVWWRRAWFQGLVVLGAASTGAIILWWRGAQRRAHARFLQATIAERTREVEHSRLQAERANQAKNRFLMTVSHDLRSPLSGIVGFTELIAGTELDDRQRRYNDGVARSAKHLAELVEDLLYQSANATLASDEPREPEPTMLQDVMDETIEFVSAGATAHEITVTSECKHCDVPVLVDARGLKYVLGNLVANAINYSGGTTVHLDAEAQRDGVYEFTIVDNGGSLDPDDTERVFEPGFRGDSVTVPGTGLGLSICQDWVVATGGRITVEVEPERSTKFTFTLKLEEAPVETTISTGTETHGSASSPAKLSRPNGTTRRASDQPVVMVVEDDELVRDVLVTMLDGIGCDVSAFDSAELALDALPARKWDLIFTDVMMQPTNGIEFARAVKLQLGAQSPPVAAITGVPHEASQAEIFDAVINKPLVAQDLQSVIDRL